jgi:hypothetical protein
MATLTKVTLAIVLEPTQPVAVRHSENRTEQLADSNPVDRHIGRFRDAAVGLTARCHGIASAHFMCPSKPSDVAMSR